MTPRNYLLDRGWTLDEEQESMAHELTTMRPWTDPDYHHETTFKDALLTQMEWDIERIAGYAAFVVLVEATGREIQF